MGRKEQPHQGIRPWFDVIDKIGILDQNDPGLCIMLLKNIFYPATDTIGVTGPAHHIENCSFASVPAGSGLLVKSILVDG